jgi:hypothetical protein
MATSTLVSVIARVRCKACAHCVVGSERVLLCLAVMRSVSAADELGALVQSGEAILFTGAGFSREARDRAGRPLPTSAEMAEELWSMLFDDGPYDGSALSDLFDVALRRVPGEVADYLRARLIVGDDPLPQHLRTWFAAPWRRIYTLNVDDLECAVARQFPLPRPLRSWACRPPHDEAPGPELEVVHLNGTVAGGVEQTTFSTWQYASRLAGRDALYEQLCEDLMRCPAVFVGTVLDEPVLWKHLEGLRAAERGRPRPPAVLVTRSLTRARCLLLEDVGIRWLQATAEDAAPLLVR